MFGPSPVLRILVEQSPDRAAADRVRLSPAGQGVWAAEAARIVGATVTLCGFLSGDTGDALRGLLESSGIRLCGVASSAPSGCYVVDERPSGGGPFDPVATAWAEPPAPAEVDALVAATCTAAGASDVLVVGNPMPGDALPGEVYRTLVDHARRAGTRSVVDLSSPRLDAALESGPDVVKVNDWELAEYVVGPVGTAAERRTATQRLRAAGARAVVVTAGPGPVHVVDADGSETVLRPPAVDGSSPAGCGDAFTGALAATLARGRSLADAVVAGSAAGAANYHLGGLDETAAALIERLARQVTD